MSPTTVVFLLLLFGAAQVVIGVCVLFGMGWGFIALGMITIAFGGLIARGVSRG